MHSIIDTEGTEFGREFEEDSKTSRGFGVDNGGSNRPGIAA